MKKVLVTGGTGFIGSHTVVELYNAGFQPVIVDNVSNSTSDVLAGIESITGEKPVFYEHDYSDKAFLAELFQKENIDGIVHFAAYKAVGESVAEPLKYYDNNVSGFITLCQAAMEHGIKTIVFSSSAAVYGNTPSGNITEESPCNPESPYGWSKRMDEVILHDLCNAHSNLTGVALRYFNVVGAHESVKIGELPKGKPQNLLPIIIQATTGQIPPLTVYGTDYPTPDGTCLRDYIHVVDLAKAHVAALQKASKGYSVYNIGTGKPTSVLELIKTFESVNGVEVPHELGPRRPGDPAACYASAEKADRELGWKAEKTIEDAVRDAWRWQQRSN